MNLPHRTLRHGAALLGAAGTLALAGCASSPSAASQSPHYVDGTYSASGIYQTPDSVEQVEVTLTLRDDIVTAVEVVGEPTRVESKQFQSRFIGGIVEQVVGVDIDELSVSRVAGSSLTSGGFNKAIEEIKAAAVE